MAAKEKINLLEVIPCRSEHITAEREGETIVLSFPRFKYPWMQRFLVPKGMSYLSQMQKDGFIKLVIPVV